MKRVKGIAERMEGIMPAVECEFEVFCGGCGAGLCGNCTEGKTPRRGMSFISVNPCEKCLETARDEGRNERG